MRTDQVSVVVPTYNEEQAVADVLHGLLSVLDGAGLAEFEILVVDDGSTDDTPRIVSHIDGVTLIQHKRNRGYGATIKTGIRHARYRWIAITDADGSYPNERLPKLLAAVEGTAMVVGARTAEDAEHSRLRQLPKLFLRRYAEWLTRAEISDLNSGLRVFRDDAVRRVLYLLPDGFSFTTTLTMALLHNDEDVRFIPVGYTARVGKSKIRPLRDTLNFLMLIIRTGTYFAPFRVFMPIAAVFFASFLVSATYDAAVLNNLTEKSLILLTLSMNLGIYALLADMIQKHRDKTT
jgi:glycosyltransferase involved in cell wall biosynthesis